MSTEIEMLQLLLEGQKEISDQLKRVHSRLDDISDKALVNEQKILHIEKDLCEEKAGTKERFDIVHASIRRRDKNLKWLATSIIIPICISILAFFKDIVKIN